MLEVQGHAMNLDFHVIHMSQANIVLGYERLHGLVSLVKKVINIILSSKLVFDEMFKFTISKYYQNLSL